MKKVLFWCLTSFLALFLFFPYVFGANVGDIAPVTDTTDLSWIDSLRNAWSYGQNLIADYKNFPIYARVFLIIQIVMFVFRSPLSMFAGKWRLILVVFLSFAGIVFHRLALGTPGLDLFSDPAIVAGFSVLVHQIYKQFKKTE